MMTAIALGAVLSAVAVPNVISFQREYQLTSAANQLGFDIARARFKAIGEHVAYRVRFPDQTNANWYWLENSTDGTTYTQDGPLIKLPGDVVFTSTAVPSFNRQGISSSAVQISMRNGAGSLKRVQVNTLGRVTVQ